MGENSEAAILHPLAPGEEASKGKRGPWDDKAMLALLMDALHSVREVDPGDCDLVVRDSVAYIRGSVGNVAQKRAVAKAALAVPGLKAIVNDLRIARLSPSSDKHIAAEVRAALAKAGIMPRLPEVKVVDGVVYLSGRVGALETKFAAEEAAWSVRGVEYVVNNIAVEPCPRSDTEILRDIQQTMSHCLALECTEVQAEVRGGMVYLRGRVYSEYRKFLIEDAVRWTPCVIDVFNELMVASPPPN